METSSRTAQLCIAGTQAEFERRIDDARRCYLQAWQAVLDDYDAAIAAHYVAHLESDAGAALPWHLRALEAAYRGDDRTREFRASLHVSLGGCYETLGMPEAERHFAIAAQLGIVHTRTR